MNKADVVLKEIEGMAEKKFLPIIGPRKGKVLVEVIREIKPKRILEVGTLIGYSAILMGKELGHDASIVTIEIRAGEAETAEKNVKRAEIPPTVKIIIGDAKKVIPRLKGKFDVVFIDDGKSEYRDYMRLVEGKLHKGSTLVADNAGISANEMKEYLDYVRFSGKYRSRYVAVGEDGLEISVKL